MSIILVMTPAPQSQSWSTLVPPFLHFPSWTPSKWYDIIFSDYDKTFKLYDKLLLATCDESGDTTQFAEFIAKNVQVKQKVPD